MFGANPLNPLKCLDRGFTSSWSNQFIGNAENSLKFQESQFFFSPQFFIDGGEKNLNTIEQLSLKFPRLISIHEKRRLGIKKEEKNIFWFISYFSSATLESGKRRLPPSFRRLF